MTVVRSMTGFATAQSKLAEKEINCEIRSLNSRFLEMFVKLPRKLADLEQPIKEIIRKKIPRGKITFSLSLNGGTEELQNVKINQEMVKFYTGILEQIKSSANITSEITLDHLLTFKDIISLEEDDDQDEAFRKEIFAIAENVCDRLNGMREQEGANLMIDLSQRISQIQKLSAEVAELSKDNPKIEFDKLYQRIQNLLNDEKIDPVRLEQELAIISDKVDITEETVRMRSHLDLFGENLTQGSPIGKKLNFILQEMHREVNTMSNKTTLLEVSHRVVIMKEEIEKIREQVQNIE